MGKGGRYPWRPEDAFGASAAIEGLAALAIGITAICALVRIKIKGDAARKCFLWLSATMGVFSVAYLLSMTASAIYTFLHGPLSYRVAYLSSSDDLIRDAHRLEPIGRLLRRIGVAMCAVMITEVANGVNTICAVHDGLPLTRSAVYASSAIAIGLALTEAILAILFVDANDKATRYSSPSIDDQFNGSKTGMALGGGAVLVLIFGSISVVLTAFKAAKASSKMEELKVSMNLLKTAAVTFLVVRFWSIAELSLLFAPRRQDTDALAWFYIVDPFMDRVGTFLVLLLVYYIGIRSIDKGGLWSSSRSRSTPY